MYNVLLNEMGLSIRWVVVFVEVVLYRTWMLLWKWVVVFVGLLYSLCPQVYMKTLFIYVKTFCLFENV